MLVLVNTLQCCGMTDHSGHSFLKYERRECILNGKHVAYRSKIPHSSEWKFREPFKKFPTLRHKMTKLITRQLTLEIYYNNDILFVFHQMRHKYNKKQTTKINIEYRSHWGLTIFFPPIFWLRLF